MSRQKAFQKEVSPHNTFALPRIGDILNKMNSHILELYKAHLPKYEKYTENYSPDTSVKTELTRILDVPEGGEYEGGVDPEYNHRSGLGTCVFKDGTVYHGYWALDQPHGKGFRIFIDKDFFIGDFKRSKMNGFGTYTKGDGSVYSGNWKNNQQSGKGTQKWKDGSSYDGEWSHGKKEGEGTFIWSDESVYKGNFHKDKFQNHGEYKWADGNR